MITSFRIEFFWSCRPTDPASWGRSTGSAVYCAESALGPVRTESSEEKERGTVMEGVNGHAAGTGAETPIPAVTVTEATEVASQPSSNNNQNHSRPKQIGRASCRERV